MLKINNPSVSLFILPIILLLGAPSIAQNTWEENTTTELEEVQVEIVKNREIILPKANRNFEKIPPLPVQEIDPKLEYEFKNFNFKVPPLEFKLRPLKTKQQPLAKLYNGYVAAGYGNYVTPYFEGFYGNKRNKRYNYGVHLKHISSNKGPIDDENSGVGNTLAHLYAKMFARKVAVGVNALYNNRQNHYYGYPTGNIVNENQIEHDFNQFGVNASAVSINTTIPYSFDLGYNFISDNYSLDESEFNLGFNTTVGINKKSDFTIEGSFNYLSQNDLLFKSHNRMLVSLKPQYHFQLSNVQIAAGLNITYADDTLSKLSKFRLYPAINAKYQIGSGISVAAKFVGSTIKTSYRELSNENAFIQANSPVYFANNVYTLGASVSGQIGSAFIVNAGLDYGKYKNSLFYLNDVINTSQFELKYDTGSISKSNFYLELGYGKSTNAQLSLRGDYYVYGMDILAEAWQRPQYEIEIQGIFNLYQKILITPEMALIGGIKAKDDLGTTITLEPIFDINCKVEYLISDRFSAFVQFKNILSQEYQFYNRYPVKGIQFIAGLSYSF